MTLAGCTLDYSNATDTIQFLWLGIISTYVLWSVRKHR